MCVFGRFKSLLNLIFPSKIPIQQLKLKKERNQKNRKKKGKKNAKNKGKVKKKKTQPKQPIDNDSEEKIDPPDFSQSNDSEQSNESESSSKSNQRNKKDAFSEHQWILLLKINTTFNQLVFLTHKCY